MTAAVFRSEECMAISGRAGLPRRHWLAALDLVPGEGACRDNTVLAAE